LRAGQQPPTGTGDLSFFFSPAQGSGSGVRAAFEEDLELEALELRVFELRLWLNPPGAEELRALVRWVTAAGPQEGRAALSQAGRRRRRGAVATLPERRLSGPHAGVGGMDAPAGGRGLCKASIPVCCRPPSTVFPDRRARETAL